MNHDVILTNPDGITAQEMTHRSIHDQAAALSVEQGEQLIELSRAVRSFSFLRRVQDRHRGLYVLADDDTWREMVQKCKPARALQDREWERAKQASYKAQDLGAHQGLVVARYRDALKAGRDDAESMTKAEIRAFIRDMQS